LKTASVSRAVRSHVNSRTRANPAPLDCGEPQPRRVCEGNSRKKPSAKPKHRTALEHSNITLLMRFRMGGMVRAVGEVSDLSANHVQGPTQYREVHWGIARR